MRKKQRFTLPLLIGVSTCALGAGILAPAFFKWTGKPSENSLSSQTSTLAEAEVKKLASLPAELRTAKLEELSQQEQSLARSRARYLLATDWLERGDPAKALELLDGLDREYDLLAPYVLYKQAQAHEVAGDTDRAQNRWQELVKQHPDAPVTAEALYVLGKKEPEYWEKAITQFPAYPRTVEIALQQIAAKNEQPELLLLLAKHGLYLREYGQVVEKLSQKYAAWLKPEDWETIAFGYWEKQDYGKASQAYAKAPRTARNLYRKARGLWLDGKEAASKTIYQQLIQEFPEDSENTGLGLIRLSRLSDWKDALVYLDRAIAKFPNHAPAALLDKSKILDKQGKDQLASQARQQLLSKYSTSDAAAEMRWSLAQQAAKAGNIKGAWQWAREITNNNPESELAPEAAFWVGKWASRAGRGEDASKAYEYTLLRYPESYFAWRSAVMLGWPVGDFTTVRPLSPTVERPGERPQLLAGSETLKELYQLGQHRDAWALWQAEYKNPMQPSVEEQYTDGLIRMGMGDHIDGLWMLTSLSQREDPAEKSQYISIRHQLAYWQALYPFPYLETIVKWSQEHQLNPILVTALIRQESRFMPLIKSSVGATGLMQVMPETGEWIAKQINLKNYSLENVNDNVKLGTWYLDHTHDEYRNNSLLAVASYNAGPGAVSDWLQRFSFSDPDAFVEKIPYPETKGYVKSVFENYWNYLRIYNPEISQLMSQHQAKIKK